MNIGSISSLPANTVSLQTAPGQTPVSLESSSSRISTTKPIESLASSARPQLRTREIEPGANLSAGITADASVAGDDSQSQDARSAGATEEGEREERREQAQLRQDQQLIQQLASRDREVRAHEQAHVAAGGQYAGAARYEYQRGPDGVNYAVGGEVSISTGKEATPQETIQKAQIVRRAALAPAEPSPQDRSVAAQASRLEANARRELAAETAENREAEAADREASIASQANDPGSINASSINNSDNESSSTAIVGSRGSDSDASALGAERFNAISSRLNQVIANTSPVGNAPGSILSLIA